MALNDAQQAAAQVAETRATLANQGHRKGLAESIRQDFIKDARRQQQMGSVTTQQQQ